MRFDQQLEQPLQKNAWSCFANSLAWSLEALGHTIERKAFGLSIVRARIITPRGFLVDKTGHELAAWGESTLLELGLAASYVYDASFEQIAAEAGLYPLVIGSSSWLHYAAVRDYDPLADVLLLANSSPGWMFINETMSRAEHARYRPISLTRIATPDLIGEIGEQHAHRQRSGSAERCVPHALYVPAAGPPRVDEGGSPDGGAGGLPTWLLGSASRRRLLHELRREPAGAAGR